MTIPKKLEKSCETISFETRLSARETHHDAARRLFS
jgi:hypothetical protein